MRVVFGAAVSPLPEVSTDSSAAGAASSLASVLVAESMSLIGASPIGG
ncbi:hypothetical protein I551_0417 [Mycobacterium ulcerans str. Harvey]|uniref:Uncharacterized protein n=1 Tax=Mycobacterium ulcerans str. Harvey TaxID=1299332 RepID=A0ABP3APR3_MYCUL|nr:hypothetical protein I551_0417 [Mycobacterium ulcerans str. Harvey]